MKKLSFFALLLAPLRLIAQTRAEKEINTFLDQWHLDATNADMEEIHPSG
jgi:hypothetical protein